VPASKNRLARREVAGAAAVLVALLLVAIGAGSRGSANVHVHFGRAAAVVAITLLVLLGVGIAVAMFTGPGRSVIGRRLAVALGVLAVLALLTWWIGPGLHGKPSNGNRPNLPQSSSLPASSSNVTSVHSPLLSPLPLVVGGLVVVLLVVAVVLAVRAHHRSQPDDEEAATRQAVYAAVDAGDDAMRDVLDPRAAIIACYAAMEHALATAGVRRLAAETPNDLLARAAALNRAPAAAALLTELFLEARYSTHPMSAADRHAARSALTELRAPHATPTSAGLS
jgi:hypothetical protein